MRRISKYLLLLFAIFLCSLFALFASAEAGEGGSGAAVEDGEEILFSYGTAKDQNYVKRKDAKTIKDILDENTSGNMYITLYSDCTYSEVSYELSNSRKLYLDVNGYTLTVSTAQFIKIKSGAQAYFYSSAAGGAIDNISNSDLIYSGSSNCYFTIGCDSYSSPNCDTGKNLTVYTSGSLSSSHGRTYIFGASIVGTGKVAPIKRSTYYALDNKAVGATFFLEECTAVETLDSAGTQFTVYEQCTFVNANSPDKNVVLSPNTGSTFTNCSFVGIIPTGSEGTFSVTDASIPVYGSAESAAVVAEAGRSAAKTSSAPIISYQKKSSSEIVFFTANVKLLPDADIISVSWKCGEHDVLTEKWQKGSVPYLEYAQSSTLSFKGNADEAVSADAVLRSTAYPTDALLGSLSLYASIDFNIYFKQGSVSDMKVDGVSVDPTEIVLHKGVPYMLYVYSGMDPKAAAAKSFEITYTYTEGGKSYPCVAKASVVDYAKDMLCDPDQDRNYALIAALLSYVKAANDFLGEKADDVSSALSDYEKAGVEYKDDYIAPAVVPTPQKNIAVDGATFRLGSRPGFAFLLKPGYSGTLTVYIDPENQKTYNCAEGSADVLVESGNRWIIFDPFAYELVSKKDGVYEGRAVTVKEGETLLFNYSIDTYIAGVANQSGIPAAKELYNYCRMAYEYFYEKKDLPYTTDAIVVNPNGAKGVASFVIDDLNKETATYIADVLVKNNPDLKVSHGAIANVIATLQTETGADGKTYFKKDINGNYVYTLKESNYNFWKEQAELGYCDFINHSYSHAYQGADNSGADGYPVDSITAEFLASKQILNDLFGELSKDVYVIPGVGQSQSDYYDSYLASLMGLCNEFIAARGTGGGPMDSEDIMNNLTWLNAPMIGHKDDTSTWTGYLDQAVAEEALMCYCIHRIYEDASGNSQAIYYEQAETLFGYAQDLVDKGDLEIMFYYDALRYFMEKDAVDVFAQTYGNEKIEVSLYYVDQTIAADSRMNAPLTVKIEVPANWRTVKYVQDGKESYASVNKNGAECFAYVNLVPGGATAVVTPVITDQDIALESDFAVDLGDGVKLDKNYFPGFTRKSVTFTIDDGNITYDEKFLDILKPAGILGTFNLISTENTTPDAYRELYEGYEVANHHYLHCLPMIDGFDSIPMKDEVYNDLGAIRSDPNADINYIYKSPIDGFYFIDWHYVNPQYTGGSYWHPIATDEAYKKYEALTKAEIEGIFGEGSVVGFAYPHGRLSDTVKQYLIDQGYLYARKTGLLKATTNFALPDDRFAWTYNAANDCLLEVMRTYDAYADDGELKMFSFGVHSADYSNSWDMLSTFAETYGNRPEDFYYATNRDIFEYEDAVNALTYRNGILTNDTDITLYVSLNGVKTLIPAHSSYRVSDGMILPDYNG